MTNNKERFELARKIWFETLTPETPTERRLVNFIACQDWLHRRGPIGETDPPTPPAAPAKVIVMPIRTSSDAVAARSGAGHVIQLDLDPMPRVHPFGRRDEVRTRFRLERAQRAA